MFICQIVSVLLMMMMERPIGVSKGRDPTQPDIIYEIHLARSEKYSLQDLRNPNDSDDDCQSTDEGLR